MANRRRSDRFAVTLPVVIKGGRGSENTLTANVSAHGVAVFTERPFPVRQYVELELRVPPGGDVVSVTAMVARTAAQLEDRAGLKHPGVAFDFYLFDAKGRSTWRAFLDRLRAIGAPTLPAVQATTDQAYSSDPPARATAPPEAEEEDGEETLDGGDSSLAAFLVKPRDVGRLWGFYRNELGSMRVKIESPVLKPVGSPVEVVVVHPVSREEWPLRGQVLTASEHGRGRGPMLEVQLADLGEQGRLAFRDYITSGRIEGFPVMPRPGDDIATVEHSRAALQPAAPQPVVSIPPPERRPSLPAMERKSLLPPLPPGAMPIPSLAPPRARITVPIEDSSFKAAALPSEPPVEKTVDEAMSPLLLSKRKTDASALGDGPIMPSEAPDDARTVMRAPMETTGGDDSSDAQDIPPKHQIVRFPDPSSMAKTIDEVVPTRPDVEAARAAPPSQLPLAELETAPKVPTADLIAPPIGSKDLPIVPDPLDRPARPAGTLDIAERMATSGILAPLEGFDPIQPVVAPPPKLGRGDGDPSSPIPLPPARPRVDVMPARAFNAKPPTLEPLVSPPSEARTPAPLRAAMPRIPHIASDLVSAAQPRVSADDVGEDVLDFEIVDEPSDPDAAPSMASEAPLAASDTTRRSDPPLDPDEETQAPEGDDEERPSTARAESRTDNAAPEPLPRSQSSLFSAFFDEYRTARPTPAPPRAPTPTPPPLLTPLPDEVGFDDDETSGGHAILTSGRPASRSGRPASAVGRSPSGRGPPPAPAGTPPPTAAMDPRGDPRPPPPRAPSLDRAHRVVVEPRRGGGAARTAAAETSSGGGHRSLSTAGSDPALDRDIALARARVVRSPGSVTACYHLGKLLLRQGAPESLAEADQQLHRAVELEPSHPGAHLAAAELAARQGRFDLAADHLQRARRLGYRIDERLEKLVAQGRQKP